MTMVIVPARFWAKVDKSGACWLWTGGRTGKGYGSFWLGGKDRRVHRLVFEAYNGPVADRMHVHHMCGVRHCVNPAHLVSVSVQQHNALHGSLLDSCKHGHAYTPENTYRYRCGKRSCRTCDRARHRRYYGAERAT